MTDRLRVACVQVRSTAGKAANIARVEPLVAEAAAGGAELVLLPEKWNARGDAGTSEASAEPIDGGATVAAMRSWARRHAITLVGGSIAERRPGREKLSNTCLVFDREGELVSLYRKIHLFDVAVGGFVYRESDSEEPGDEMMLCDVDGWRLGLSICYDLRFPELYRHLAVAGAQVLVVPAAFMMHTGRDHWEVLLRARAIENQCYVLAAGQIGDHEPGRTCFGRSMVVDPWGTVLAQAPDTTGVTVADIDLARLHTIREELPSLANRRL